MKKTFRDAGLINFDPTKTALKQAKTKAVAAVASGRNYPCLSGSMTTR
jgi:hypothetical protein